MTAGTAHDPKENANYRVLQAVVIILGILIVFAFVALVIGAISKFSGHRSAADAASPASVAAYLPAGSRIISFQASGDRVIVAVHAPGGDEVDIFEAETGKPVARIRPATAPAR